MRSPSRISTTTWAPPEKVGNSCRRAGAKWKRLTSGVDRNDIADDDIELWWCRCSSEDLLRSEESLPGSSALMQTPWKAASRRE